MLRCRAHREALALLMAIGLFAPPASGQETREEVIAAEQAEKARQTRGYRPSRVERIVDAIESGKWLDPAVTHGVFPTFESIFPGGGFSAGLGIRHFTGFASFVDVRGVYSLSGYKKVEARVMSPRNFDGRFDAGLRVGWRDATQVAYFGLGDQSSTGDRANFRLQEGYAEGTALLRPAPWAFIGTSVGYDDYRERDGRGAFATIGDRFDDRTAPGLGTDPRYVRGMVQGGFDWLPSPGYSRSGGKLRYAHTQYAPVGGTDGASFGIARSEVVQHIPFLRETWVLSLRGHGESVIGGGRVPYFLLPWLGSGTTLRAYETGRFRDRHAMLFSAEWRWTPNRLGLDMALFADAGDVADRFRSLGVRRMKTDVGIGLRLHSATTTALRLEAARGSEGWRFLLTSGAPF